MANGTLHIFNGSSLTLYYGVWWGGSRKKFEPIYAGGSASYDDANGAKFNVGFYFQTASTGTYNQSLVGQAMDVPTNDGTSAKKQRVTITQGEGGFRITMADADIKPVATADEERRPMAAAALPAPERLELP